MDVMDMVPDAVKDWVVFALTSYPSWLSPLASTFKTLRTLLLPLVARLTTAPDLASIGILIIVLIVSVQLLNMLVSAVVFWVKMAFRAAVAISIAFAALYVYSRGIEGTVADVSAFVGAWLGEGQSLEEQAEARVRAGQYPGGRGYVRKANTGWRANR